MRAIGSVLQVLAIGTLGLDERLRRALAQVVKAALRAGGGLQLTRLGRYLRRSTSQKHRVKMMDRLLGNRRIHNYLEWIYRAIARHYIKARNPVLLVDWTHLRGDMQALVAAIPMGGRALPVLVHVHRKAKRATRQMHRSFLLALARVLPAGCKATLVTDAGFQSTWLKDAEELGFGFVARIRHRTCVRAESGGEWIANKTLHATATSKARDLGRYFLGKDLRIGARPLVRLVLARKPRRHRHRVGKSGKVLRGGMSVAMRKQYAEPWLLATNLESTEAAQVVFIYGQRMQIEETFRDLKSESLGRSLSISRSRSPERFAVLMLIGTLAWLCAWTMGTRARRAGLHRLLQVNTSRHVVLSAITVGMLLLTTYLGPAERQLFEKLAL